MSVPLQGLPPASPHCRIRRLRDAIEHALLALYEREERRQRWLLPDPAKTLRTALDDDAARGPPA